MKYFISTLFLFFVCWQTAKASTPTDSVGVAMKNGEYFIIHQVKSRQTLFALSKIYKVSIQKILEANDNMRPALATGQLLYVPTKKNVPSPNIKLSSIVNGRLVGAGEEKEEQTVKAHEKKKEKEQYTTPIKKKKTKETRSRKEEIKEKTKPSKKFNWNFYYGDEDLFHTVKRGETLYKIANYYGLSVQEIMEVNNLDNSLIEKGQELLIRKGKKKKKTTRRNAVPKKEKKKVLPKAKTPAKTKTKVEKEKPTTTHEVKEAGTAMIIDDSFPDNDKNIAMHTKAKVGTIILVTNPANNKKVYVRVVGLLQTDDKSVVIMLSPVSAKAIGIKSGKGQIQLSYAQ